MSTSHRFYPSDTGTSGRFISSSLFRAQRGESDSVASTLNLACLDLAKCYP